MFVFIGADKIDNATIIRSDVHIRRPNVVAVVTGDGHEFLRMQEIEKRVHRWDYRTGSHQNKKDDSRGIIFFDGGRLLSGTKSLESFKGF